MRSSVHIIEDLRPVAEVVLAKRATPLTQVNVTRIVERLGANRIRHLGIFESFWGVCRDCHAEAELRTRGRLDGEKFITKSSCENEGECRKRRIA